jgi:hypothetical protein
MLKGDQEPYGPAEATMYAHGKARLMDWLQHKGPPKDVLFANWFKLFLTPMILGL